MFGGSHSRNGAKLVALHVTLRTLFVRDTFSEAHARGASRAVRACAAVNVDPLLREMVLHVARLGTLWEHAVSQQRLALVLLDRIEKAPMTPLSLPWPSDPRARRVAELIVHDIGTEGSLNDALEAAGASRRTVERLFTRETAMTLGQWRQRARLVESLRLLGRGRDVTNVAYDVGYRSPSAFIAAFRSQLGTTPGHYFV